MNTVRLLTVAVALALSLGVSACGSGGSTSADGKTTSPVEASGASPPESEFTPRPHHDSGGGAGQFRHPGGDNSIQEYGDEGSGSERAAAAGALHTYLDARAAGAWGAACGALSTEVAEELVRQLSGAPGGEEACPKVLASFNAGVSSAALREAAEADVGALRSQGASGFLLFKGGSGEPLFIPVHREDGHWKVAAVGPSPLS